MAYTYYAFVSYSRKDKAAARYLQNKLESYRYPAVLVDPDHKPENPKYLRKIFRDTSDLDVTQSNFTESIDRHIAESRYLVVLCSPNSAKSVWVDREIVRFLETHDDNPQLIFPIILEGDVPECLPEKLRTPEFFNRNIPTMIPDDASSRKEGWEHGFLQLVGCMLNVSIAKITDRFQKAKQAALRRIIVGILAVLAVTVGLTVWALIAEYKARIAEKKAVAAEKVARHEAEIANASLEFIKDSFDAADANKSGNKDMTLLEFAKTSAGELDKIPLPEVRLRVAAITLPLVSGMGDPKTALKYFAPLLPEAKKLYPPKSPQMKKFHLIYAKLIYTNGRYAEALTLYEQLRDEMAHEKASPAYAEVLYWTGWTYYRLGKYDDAIAFAQQALELYRKLSGADTIDAANCENLIGATYSDKSEYDKAIEHYQKSLAIKRKKLGPDHPSVASTLNNIGIVYNNKGEYDKAIEYYQRSLAIRRRKLGDDHPNVASSISSIGNVYSNKSEYDKAIEYYQKSLAIRLKKLGDDHPSVASSLLNIGNLYNRSGNYDKAVEYYEQALAAYRKKLGNDHPSAALALGNIGWAYLYKKEYVKAIENYRESLEIYRRKLGNDHPSTVYNELGLGYSLVMAGKPADGFKLIDHALAVQHRKLGAEHPVITMTYHYLGLAFLEMYRKNRAPADLQAAEKYLNLARDVRMKKFGPNHSKTQATIRALEEMERLRPGK